MAGANGVKKFLPCDREEAISPLKTVGTEFKTRVITTVASSTISAVDFVLSDLLLNNALLSPYTGPSAAQILTEMGLDYLNAVGTTFKTTIENSTGVDQVINFGAGFTPASITIPANSVQTLTWEVTSVNPAAIRLLNSSSNLSPPAAGVTSFEGRVGPVVSAIGDYNSDEITNLSLVPGADVTDALNALQAQSGVVSFEGRQGVVTSANGDYTASEITNVPMGSIAALTVQAAIDELALEKVSLGNATAAQDILVATAAGDNYAPSGTVLPGRIGALTAGQSTGGVTQTTNGAVLEAQGSGAIPLNGLIHARMGADQSLTGNYSVMLADASANLLFGQAPGVAQSLVRAILPAGIPAATNGVDGAYVFSYDNGAGKLFFVNSLGNVRIVLSGAGPATGALALDANGMITLL